jgi:polar amino acid transport system substrate-binding protein
MRRTALSLLAVSALTLASCGGGDSASDTTAAAADAGGGAGNECTTGKTLAEGKLTIATGNPAYSPWVENDKPEAKEGYEAAVAYAIAGELGFSDANVTWVRTDFDAAIQPGKKNFDFNLQQFSITDERKQTVDFSEPYYTTNQAIVALAGSAAEGATNVSDLKGVKFGAQAGTTSLDFIKNVIKPSSEPFVYDDNAGAKAALEAKQIDAIVVDLPTAFYIAAVEIEGAKVVGQFPADETTNPDQFGLVFDKGNALVTCVNTAIEALKTAGTIDGIAKTWLSDKYSAPVIALS